MIKNTYFKLYKIYIQFIKNNKQNKERIKIDILLNQIRFILCDKKEYKKIIKDLDTIIITGYTDRSCDEIKHCKELCCIKDNTIYITLDKSSIKDDMYICCVDHFIKKYKIKYSQNICYFSIKLNNLILKQTIQ